MMNILIVGLGSIARKHIQALQALEIPVQLLALRSSAAAPPMAGVTNLYSLEALPEQLDFAIISAPSNLHGFYIRELAQRGIPLFIEKPPLSMMQEATQLEQLISDAELLTYVACNLRFHPCLQFLKQYVLNNPALRLNELNVYCGSYLPEWRPQQDFRKVYSANADAGGGVHLDLFHELDYTCWIFGIPQHTHVLKRKASSLQINACDYANYILEYTNFTASIVLNYYRRDPKRTIEMVMDDSTWTVDLIRSRIIDQHGNLVFEAPAFQVQHTYKLQMQYFLEQLRTRQQPMNNFTESIQTLRICLNVKD